MDAPKGDDVGNSGGGLGWKTDGKVLHRFVLFCLMELRVKGNNAWLEWFYYCRCVALIGEVFL